MYRISSKFPWVLVPLATIVACAGLVAHAAGRLAEAQLGEVALKTLPGGRSGVRAAEGVGGRRRAIGDGSAAAAADRSSLVASLASRNIFCSSCPASSQEKPGGGLDDASAPLEQRPAGPLGWRLLATLVSSEPEWSFAVVQDIASGRSALLRAGDELQEGVLLVEVCDGGVQLDRGEGAEWLTLRETGAAGAGGQMLASADKRLLPQTQASQDSGVRELERGRYEVDRRALESVLSSPATLARVRVLPHTTDGRPDGLTLQSVPPASIFASLGLRSGDTIHAVNGQAVRSPEAWLEAYTRLRGASNITLGFRRAGATMSHDYTIR